MSLFEISIGDVILDLAGNQTLADLPSEEVVGKAQVLYSFLPGMTDVVFTDGTLKITRSNAGQKNLEPGEKAYRKGLEGAQAGNYQKAIDMFSKALKELPDYIEARRNLAMSYMESGKLEPAKKHLHETLLLNPNDPWTLLLAANLFAKHERRFDVAARYYDRAYTLDPNDPHIVTSYGGLLMQMGKLEEAKEMFEATIDNDPAYPNTYLGLSMIVEEQGLPVSALEVLKMLFNNGSQQDPRSRLVYTEARKRVARLYTSIAESTTGGIEELLIGRKATVESESGHPVVIKEDSTLQVASKTETAWKHSRPEHLIIHARQPKAVLPHHILRGLEHVAMENEARSLGRNKKFATTGRTREIAINQMSSEIYKLRDSGVPEQALTQYVHQVVVGITMQLYNFPFDMATEYRIHHMYPWIHPHQFVSLQFTLADNLRVAESRDAKRMTPPLIYNANLAMNYAYARFCDSLWGGATDYASQYPDARYKDTGNRLFAIWEDAAKDFTPGDEFDLMSQYGEILKINGWFEIIPDVTETTLAGYNPPETDQELLKERDPATLMYLLGALQRFSTMPIAEVRQIATEISIVGMNGITYTDPEKKYSLRSLPGEDFGGLQLLAMMYVSWQLVDPSVDTGLEFKDIYRSALQLHEGKSR